MGTMPCECIKVSMYYTGCKRSGRNGILDASEMHAAADVERLFLAVE